MTDENQNGIPDDVESLGRRVLKNPFSYIVGAFVLAASTLGIDKALDNTGRTIGGVVGLVCGASLKTQELELEILWRDKFAAYKAEYLAETGDVLRSACDEELRIQGDALGIAFAGAISAAIANTCSTSAATGGDRP